MALYPVPWVWICLIKIVAVAMVFYDLSTLFSYSRMKIESPAWYCARTKPKHEHIAAANVRKNLKLEVFNPRLRVERATQRGMVRSVEPLFPCYVFVRCIIEEKLNDIQHTNGVSSLVRFGHRIPRVGDPIIEELQKYFEAEEPMAIEDRLSPSDQVIVANGAFAGMQAKVLRIMPATRRVQILLDILGGPTSVEVDRASVVLGKNALADRVPILAAPLRERVRV
jgi:transcriptional antiterminator RfaH